MNEPEDIIANVYFQRNMAVLLAARLAKKHGYAVHWKEDVENYGWPVVYIQLPNGQVSWHVSRECLKFLHAFRHTKNKGIWDGHSTDEKHRRIKNFIRYSYKKN